MLARARLRLNAFCFGDEADESKALGWPLNPDQERAVFESAGVRSGPERLRAIADPNKGFEEWGAVLGDEVIAAALIDWLLHPCHIVNTRGSSYRMREHWKHAVAEGRRWAAPMGGHRDCPQRRSRSRQKLPQNNAIQSLRHGEYPRQPTWTALWHIPK